MFRILGSVFAGLVGLAFGSFLNVCLSRWPAGESVVKPPSHCRHCGRRLTWQENVPVLSWLVLRGRCKSCKGWIGWRYVLVEFAVGALWAMIAWQMAGQFLGPVYYSPEPVSFSPLFVEQASALLLGKMLLAWLLVGLAALDAEHLWLPDIATLPGIIVGAAIMLFRSATLLQPIPFSVPLLVRLLDLAFDLLIAAGLILLIRWLYWLARHREGIGLGDAKLMAMLAAWLGLPGALLAFVIGVLLGALAGVAIVLAPKSPNSEPAGLTKLPLGTFLCIGGMVSLLCGSKILVAYLGWSGLP
jgi:leader peptidase (prepilin peptidase) / N-methyltransferase